MPLQLAPGVQSTALDHPSASGTHPAGAELPESSSASVGVHHEYKEGYLRQLEQPSGAASPGEYGWQGSAGPKGPQQSGMHPLPVMHARYFNLYMNVHL